MLAPVPGNSSRIFQLLCRRPLDVGFCKSEDIWFKIGDRFNHRFFLEKVIKFAVYIMENISEITIGWGEVCPKCRDLWARRDNLHNDCYCWFVFGSELMLSVSISILLFSMFICTSRGRHFTISAKLLAISSILLAEPHT